MRLQHQAGFKSDRLLARPNNLRHENNVAHLERTVVIVWVERGKLAGSWCLFGEKLCQNLPFSGFNHNPVSASQTCTR